MSVVLELFEENISKFLSSLGLATREDVDIIEDRLARLEERLADVKALYKAQAVPVKKAPARATRRDVSSVTRRRTATAKKTAAKTTAKPKSGTTTGATRKTAKPTKKK